MSKINSNKIYIQKRLISSNIKLLHEAIDISNDDGNNDANTDYDGDDDECDKDNENYDYDDDVDGNNDK